MSPVLECVIAVFVIVLIVVIVVLTIYAVKFLEELTKTTASIRELTDLTKQELEPAFKSVNGVLASVNEVTSAANRKLEMIKKIVATAIGASVMAFSKVASKDNGGFLSGVKSGFNIFRKKGDKNVSR